MDFTLPIVSSTYNQGDNMMMYNSNTNPLYYRTGDIQEYLDSKKDVNKSIKFACKLLFNSFCEKFPNEEEIWKTQLKLNNNDYEITLPYIIDRIRQIN